MLCNADGNGGVKFSRKKLYKCVRFNISVTRGWVGVQFPGKKHYITLEWPLIEVEIEALRSRRVGNRRVVCLGDRVNYELLIVAESRRTSGCQFYGLAYSEDLNTRR